MQSQNVSELIVLIAFSLLVPVQSKSEILRNKNLRRVNFRRIFGLFFFFGSTVENIGKFYMYHRTKNTRRSRYGVYKSDFDFRNISTRWKHV